MVRTRNDKECLEQLRMPHSVRGLQIKSETTSYRGFVTSVVQFFLFVMYTLAVLGNVRYFLADSNGKENVRHELVHGACSMLYLILLKYREVL
jgi:hypothetical protein